jgi:hypothetical protein
MGQSGIVYTYSALLHLSLTFKISLLLKSSTAVVASFVLNIPIPWRSQREEERTENGRGQVFFCPAWLIQSPGEVEAENDFPYTGYPIVGAAQLLSRLPQWWKSQRSKFHRLVYRFSIDFLFLGLSKVPDLFLAITDI